MIPDCATLNELGDSMVELTVDQLSDMDVGTYTDCMDPVGRHEWSDDRRAALYDLFKEVFWNWCDLIRFIILITDERCLQSSRDAGRSPALFIIFNGMELEVLHNVMLLNAESWSLRRNRWIQTWAMWLFIYFLNLNPFKPSLKYLRLRTVCSRNLFK